MEQFAARVLSLSAVVLALAFSAPALALDEAVATQTATAAAATHTATVSAATTTSSAAVASAGTATQQKPKRVRRKINSLVQDYRNPQGSILTSFFFGIGVDSETGTTVAFGLGMGYAFFTGVVPGVRAEFIYNDGAGGELAAPLTLTPPLSWSITPFALGETGFHWQNDRRGFMYGAGVGAYLGDPTGHLAVQLGWIWRAIVYDTGPHQDGSGPLLALTYRF